MHYYFNCLSTYDFSSYARRRLLKPSLDKWLLNSQDAKDVRDLLGLGWDFMPRADKIKRVKEFKRLDDPSKLSLTELPLDSDRVNKVLLDYNRPNKFVQMAYKHKLKGINDDYSDIKAKLRRIPQRKKHLRKYANGEIMDDPQYVLTRAEHPDYTDIRIDPVSDEVLGFPKVNGYIENIIDESDPNLKLTIKPRRYY